MKPKNKEEFALILNEVSLFSRDKYSEATEKIRNKFSHLDPFFLEMFIAKMAIKNSQVSLIYYLSNYARSETKKEFDALMIDYEKFIFDAISKG